MVQMKDGDFRRIERQAARMSCRLMTAQAYEELLREQRVAAEEVTALTRRAERAEREVLKLRKEVSILHFRMKSPWARFVTRRKLRKLHAESAA